MSRERFLSVIQVNFGNDLLAGEYIEDAALHHSSSTSKRVFEESTLFWKTNPVGTKVLLEHSAVE